MTQDHNHARELLKNALVWDNHACPPVENTEAFLPRMAQYRAAGLGVLSLNVADSNIELADLVRIAARIRRYIAQHSTDYALVGTVQDIRRARKEGKLAVFFDIEGCYALGSDLELVSLFFDIGVRWMAMVYNRRNTVGFGVHDEEDGGLTPFGRQVVAEMDRVGMIKCCSHTGYRTALDVFAASRRPTIFSHSNPRALRDHPRNVPDELIKVCAASGGVICLNGIGIFLGDNDVRTETFVRHVDYVAQLVGARHAGIGLDTVFDMAGMDAALARNAHIWPPNYGYAPGIRIVQPEQLAGVTEALLRLGYTDDDVRGILGENLLRVAGEVWPE